MTARLDPLAAAPSLMKEWHRASLAISARIFSLKTVPVGLFGELKMSTFVRGVTFDAISAISG